MAVWAELSGPNADDWKPRFDNPGEWRIAEADVIECLEHGLKSEEAFERGDLAEGFFYLKGFDTEPMAMPLDDAAGKEAPGARLH